MNRATGRIFVEKPEVLEDMVSGAPDFPGSRFKWERKIKAKSATFGPSVRSSTETHKTLLIEQQKLMNMQTETTTKKNVQKSIDKSNERQEKMFPILLANVDKATSFLDAVDRDISLHDETQKNKVRRQYEDWNTIVHGTIQKTIADSVNSMDSKALNRKKNADYNRFLNITNRKPAIFRDIIIESEYDPLEPNRKSIKARTGYLKDPVKIDAQKAASEGGMLGNGTRSTNQKQRLGKDTLAVELWASGQIEATPYGTFARIMDGNPAASEHESKTRTSHSNIHFDHFNYPVGKDAINKEMPRGKRIHPRNVTVNPGVSPLSPQPQKDISVFGSSEFCSHVD